jgi:hypothetical protein
LRADFGVAIKQALLATSKRNRYLRGRGLTGLTSVPRAQNRILLFAALAGFAALGALRPAEAADVRTVLELFTSQGCSSCPPADKLAGSLAEDKDLLVLSFPVDYWDYLGWKDTLAHSAFSLRQKAYARSRGDRQVYTPQMVINGMHHAVGSDRESIEAGAVAAGALPMSVSIEKTAEGYVVSLPAGNVPGPAEIVLLPVLHRHSVEIGRGENRGATVNYVNIVRGITLLGQWSGTALRIEVPPKALGGEAGDADSFVVLVQQGGPDMQGRILAAAKAPGF